MYADVPMLQAMEPFVPIDHLVASRLRRLEGSLPAHADPDLDRVRRGFYRPRAETLNLTQSYLLRIAATAEARGDDIVFSHASAAVLWGAPLLNVDMQWVHVTRPGKAQRTAAGVKVHRYALSDHEIADVGGFRVTSPSRTILDLAAALALPNALLPLDRLLWLLNPDGESDPGGGRSRDTLLDTLAPTSRAAARLSRADARSGSAAESLSRGQMILIGAPMPDLQRAFPRIDLPGVDIVDFDWPELETFGECDGTGKYFDVDMIGDRDPREVLWEEKQREDRVRRHRPRAVRWDWTTALSRDRLAARLASVGIVPARRAA